MGLDKIYRSIFLVFFLIATNNIYSKEAFTKADKEMIKVLVGEITNCNKQKLSKHFSFPIRDKEMINLIGNQIDSISTEEFDVHFNSFFPRKFIDLIKKLDLESKIKNKNLFIEKEDVDEKECLKYVSIKKTSKNFIVVQFGTNFNYLNSFKLEGDYFCSEYTYIYIFEIINKKLAFKEFHFAG